MNIMSMRDSDHFALGERALTRLPRDPLTRDALPFFTQGESETRQSEKASADVNAIVERFSRTGQLPPARFEGSYADVTAYQGDLTERYEWAMQTQAQYALEQRSEAEPAVPATPSADPSLEAAPASAQPAAE